MLNDLKSETHNISKPSYSFAIKFIVCDIDFSKIDDFWVDIRDINSNDTEIWATNTLKKHNLIICEAYSQFYTDYNSLLKIVELAQGVQAIANKTP